MEYARIRKEEMEMEIETDGMYRRLTHEDLVRLGLDRKGKWQYTVADIEALPEWVRAELIDGEIFVKVSAPLTIHQDILAGLFFQIEAYIQRKQGKCRVFFAPFGVRPKKDIYNYVEPDITLICDDEQLQERGSSGAPDFVIEVVSPSNRKHDYVRKFALYHEAGVREYWIVDPQHEQVTVYDWEKSDSPTLYPFSARIKVGVYDDLFLDLANRHGTLEEILTEERQTSHAEGHSEGVKEGEARLAKLTTVLLREGRTDDLTKALADATYREGLYREFSI